MKFFHTLVLISSLAIAACAAYFSIVGLKLLFVGGGISIIVMGVALEVGKLVTASFLKQYWNKIGTALKIYMSIATLVLVLITSIGIYGYLSAGYNATTTSVQAYEKVIESNEQEIKDIEKEINFLKEDRYNQIDISSIEEDRKLFIEQRMALISQKNEQIEKIRSTTSERKSFNDDIVAAKQALEIARQSLDSDTNREQEQIKLYNSRLEILDKEVQKWIDEGGKSVFRKSGLDKAREVKESQQKERGDIDSQIKKSQDRIEKLREQYAAQVKEYNDRVNSVENRLNSQKSTGEESVKILQKEISDITESINDYNKQFAEKLEKLTSNKNDLVELNKKKIETDQNRISSLRAENEELRQKVIRTDVGTFKFISKSLNIELNDAVNYFIWIIMFAFDPLAVCLILAYNSMRMADRKDEEIKPTEKEEPKNNEEINIVPKDVGEPQKMLLNEMPVQIEEPKEEQNVQPPPPPTEPKNVDGPILRHSEIMYGPRASEPIRK